jgi:hypothetical protein
MVMWFNVEEAREFLLNEGHVFTLRPKRRKRDFKNPLGYSEVLSYDGFGKKGLLYVSFVKEVIEDGELREFINDSGFDSLEDWLDKANGSRFLYFVMTLDEKPAD